MTGKTVNSSLAGRKECAGGHGSLGTSEGNDDDGDEVECLQAWVSALRHPRVAEGFDTFKTGDGSPLLTLFVWLNTNVDYFISLTL